jgi:hypothetical protein
MTQDDVDPFEPDSGWKEATNARRDVLVPFLGKVGHSTHAREGDRPNSTNVERSGAIQSLLGP